MAVIYFILSVNVEGMLLTSNMHQHNFNITDMSSNSMAITILQCIDLSN